MIYFYIRGGVVNYWYTGVYQNKYGILTENLEKFKISEKKGVIIQSTIAVFSFLERKILAQNEQ